jgi:hypothetical protein
MVSKLKRIIADTVAHTVKLHPHNIKPTKKYFTIIFISSYLNMINILLMISTINNFFCDTYNDPHLLKTKIIYTYINIFIYNRNKTHHLYPSIFKKTPGFPA